LSENRDPEVGSTEPVPPEGPPDPATPVTDPLEDSGIPAPTPLRAFAMELFGDVMKFALCFLFLYTFVFHVSVVKGSSMQPTFRNGDRLVVDTLTYRFTPIERYDVVVHENPLNEHEDFIKRVVGLPGDELQIGPQGLSVNGEHLDEEYLPDNLKELSYRPRKMIRVPEGSYFVLGDNRPASKDSRDLGPIPSRLIKGKIRLRLWPVSGFRVFTDDPISLILSLIGIGILCFVGIPYLIRAMGLK